MPSSLGSLSVSLGLDAASFIAGLDKSAYRLNKFANQANDMMGTLKKVFAAGVIVEGITKITDTFLDATEAVAKFQDMADKTGGSASGFAGMQTAAAATGTQLDAITAASTKLNKNLLTTGQEGSVVAAALKNLNINAQQFKNASPDQRMQMLADTTKNYATNANYAANISTLLGKSGADLIPFLKAQADAMGSIFTDDQIAQADAFMQKLRGTESQVKQLGEAFVMQMVPAVDAVGGAVSDFAKGLFGIDTLTGKIKGNTALADWALNAVAALLPLANIIDHVAAALAKYGAVDKWVQDAPSAFQQSFGNILTQHDIDQARAPMAKVNSDFLNQWNAASGPSTSFYDSLKAELYAARLQVHPSAATGEHEGYAQGSKPSTTTKGLDMSTATQAQAAALKAMQGNIQAIIAANKLLQDSYTQTEQTIAGVHSAGLINDDAYYASQISLIEGERDATLKSLNDQIAVYQKMHVTGAAAEDIHNKIAAAQAEEAAAVQKANAQETEITNQRAIATQQLVLQLNALALAQKNALADQQRSDAESLAGLGLGDLARGRMQGQNSLVDKASDQVRALQDQIDASNNGTGKHLTDEQIADFQRQQGIIRQGLQTQLAEYKSSYAHLDAMQGDWKNGALDSLHNYADMAANIADQTKTAFDDAFKGMEDALVTFVTTGKLSFTSLADSIVADITRIVIKQELASAAKFLAGAGATTGNNPSAYVAPSGGILAMLGSWLGSAFGGGKAIGGPVDAGKFYRVNESGPELLDVGGKQLLMMGKQGGRVVPMSQASGGGVSQTIIFNHTGSVDRGTKTQLAAAALQGLRSGQRNL